MNDKLFIKNMVCSRCVKVVKHILEENDIIANKIILGEANIEYDNSTVNFKKVEKELNDNGFELIDDKHSKLIEKIRVLIINKIHHGSEELVKFNFSKFLADQIGMNYNSLSSLFSAMEGATIERFIINQKIEKVKELLVYDELTLSEISYKLGYSSVQHLSNQFKQVTGLNPTFFKQKSKKRISLDKIH